MTSSEPEGLMRRLEEQCLHPNLSSGTASEKTDVIRNVLVHQFHARAQGIISDTGLSQVQQEYWDRYSTVVDNFDVTQGLNNFAEGALALCSLHRNESQAWRSSLTLNKFLSSPAGQGFSRSCQISADTKASIKPDQVVKLRTDVPLPADDPSATVPIQVPRPSGPPLTGAVITASHPPQSHLAPGHIQSSKAIHESGSNNTFPSKGQSSFYKQITNNQMPENRNSVHSHPGQPSTVNSFGGKQQGSFTFKKGLSRAEKNSLPYELPPGWDDAPIMEHNPRYHTPSAFQPTRNRSGYYGDQEVPRKPLFASSSGPTSSGRPGGNYPNQPQTAPNFYRRAECGREDGDPLRPEAEEDESPGGPFRTAKEQLSINQQKKYGQTRGPVKQGSYGSVKKSLGTRRGPGSKFVPPVVSRDEPGDSNLLLRKAGPNKAAPGDEEPVDERLKGLEPKMIELIMNEIMDHGAPTAWDDIAGLEFAKKTIKEIVVWPMLRPDIFTGLRGPPKGLLLFGPPGTGKTLIGKCIASQSKSTFFSISASSLTSKWVGEGEKMVKALFAVSRCHQPAVIFIDEIDSLLSQRSDGEHEASRRIKTEFLVQLDGATTESDERLLVIGATNRPQEIDEAARRRFVKRLYIPLPEKTARQQIVLNLLSSQRYQLSEQELDVVCQKTEGYSGSDMANLCREAALGPIRSIDFTEIEMITADQVRPIAFQDFDEAIHQVRASVSTKDLDLYIDWNKLYGCGGK